MTIDKAKLKALAETGAANGNWLECPATDVVALLAEIERLSPPAGQVSYQQQMEAWKSASSQDLRARGELMIQVDELKAENEALRNALGDLLALYEDDEGCRNLPEYIAGRAAMPKEASHG